MFKDNPFLGRDIHQNKVYETQTTAVRPMSDNEVIDMLFTYHPPALDTNRQYETIREAAKYFAKVIMANVPAGADRLSAVRKVREAVMTANAGIALDGVGL